MVTYTTIMTQSSCLRSDCVIPDTLIVFVTCYCNHIMARVVDIAVLLLLPIVSVIPFEYWHKYRRYFLYAVSIWVSAILFSFIFWQCSLPILLLSGALVKSVNNNITQDQCNVQGSVKTTHWPKAINHASSILALLAQKHKPHTAGSPALRLSYK